MQQDANTRDMDIDVSDGPRLSREWQTHVHMHITRVHNHCGSSDSGSWPMATLPITLYRSCLQIIQPL